MFDIDKFNIISDEEYYYVFRSLEAGDIKDINDGIESVIRTDRERCQGYTKYSKDTQISLEEMFDHIKMHYRQDTNCISFTTNASVALLYGRDKESFDKDEFNDQYVVLKIPKHELGIISHFAPKYFIDEINKIINEYYEEAPDITKYYLDYIESCHDNDSINRILNIEEGLTETEIFNGGIEFEQTQTTNYSALDEKQNLEKNKLIAKIDLLPFDIIPNVSNRFLIQTIGSAFASMEVTHYKSIDKELFVNCPQYIMDIFSLLQQSNNREAKEVEQILIKKLYNHELDNLKEYKYYDYKLEENDLSIDKLYEISEGKVDYEIIRNLYIKTFYYAKSKLRVYHGIKLLEQILENNYKELLEELKGTYGIEPEITNKRSTKKEKISDSVGISYSSDLELKLLELLNSHYISENNCEALINNKEECAQIVMMDLLQQNNKVDKVIYYANAIIDSFNWKQFGITKIGEIHRTNIINKLIESNFMDIYNLLKNKNYPSSEISRILLANLIKENKEIDEEASFELEELEEYLGYFQIKGTGIKCKRYQADALRNIRESYKTKNYTNVIMPTGSGKSFVAISQILEYLFERDNKGNIILDSNNNPILTNKNILYLAPTNEILEQVAEYLIKYVIGYKNINPNNSYLDEIRKNIPNLDLFTYAYLRQRKDIREKQYDFIVTDELHRTGAPDTKQALEELYSNQKGIYKVLGITATPTRDCDGVDMADYWARYFGYTEEEIIAEDHFSYNMDVNQAILLGYLTNPRVVNCEYNLLNSQGEIEELLNMINTLPEGDKKEKIKTKYRDLRKVLLDLKPEDGIGTILRENVLPGENCIVFCPVVNKDELGNSITGRNVLELYQRKLEEIYGKDKINCFFMLGTDTAQQCRRSLSEFQNTQNDKINFMIVMDKYNEGIHVPCKKMIWFRPIDENSTIITTQHAGRVMRALKPGEKQKEEDRPLIIDLPNNLLILSQTKEFNKTLKPDDISRFKLAVEWIKEYNRIPDINSKDKIESNMAGILKTIIFYYRKDILNIDEIKKEERKIKVEKIKKISEQIPFYIWDLRLPKRTKETKAVVEKPYWEATPIYRDFVKLKTEIEEIQNVDLIEEYIEMLADDRIKIIKASENVMFNINGQKIIRVQFWGMNNNSEKIKNKLKEEKYKYSKYDIVREKIEDYEEKGNDIKLDQLIEEYIEMLADDRIKEIKSRDSVTFYIDGRKAMRKVFWAKNAEKIKAKLKEEKYQETKYNIVRNKINNIEVNKKEIISIPVEKLIEEYIEMLADDRIKEIKSHDNIIFNISGQKIKRIQFWKSKCNEIKQRLEEEKYKNQKYDIVRNKIYIFETSKKKDIYVPVEMLIEEYIEMLADDTIKEIRSSDSVTFIIDGQKMTRTCFWGNYNKRIILKLEEEKYKNLRYDTVRKKIDDYEIKNDNIPKDQLIELYIEMLANDTIKKIKSGDSVTFHINDQEIIRQAFWCENDKKIILKLEDDKYKDAKYDIVRAKIKIFDLERRKNKTNEFELIDEYIEMLADDRIKKIKSHDSVMFNISGQKIIRKTFWKNNSDKIIIRLEDDKYKTSKYDIVRTKIKNYKENIKNDKNNISIKNNILIEEYIEMLANDTIKEIKSKDSVTFYIDGREIVRTQFWNDFKDKIILMLTDDKYKSSKYDKVRTKIKIYEIERGKVKTNEFELIEEYIEMLADNTIKEIKSHGDVVFNIDGQEIIRRSFWSSNSNKIKNKLNEDKYKNSRYDIVRKKIKDYNYAISRDIPLDQLIEEYIEMLTDDRIKEIKSTDSVTFIIDNQEKTRKAFWGSNYKSILLKLNEEKYQSSRYNIVRTKIKIYYFDFIEECIEMLVDDRIKDIKKYIPVTFYIDGQEVVKSQFWSHNIEKIIQKLEEEKYQDSRYDIARAKVEAILNIKQNKEKIEQLCDEYSIDYKKNKKYLDRLSYSIFEAILIFFNKEKPIPIIDEKGLLISDFYMSSKDFKEAHGKSFEDLLSNQKRPTIYKSSLK